MKLAICDPYAFYPLRRLVAGAFTDLRELSAVERFIRTIVLHDEIAMELEPSPYCSEDDEEAEWAEEERLSGGRMVVTAMGPALTGFDFFSQRTGPRPAPDIQLAPALVNLATQYANAGEGNVYFEARIHFLKRAL